MVIGISLIVEVSGGYRFFIQFICKEAFDAYIAQRMVGQDPEARMDLILKKLDQDFFSARWSDVTDKQRIFLYVIAQLPNCETDITAAEAARASEAVRTAVFIK